jgi:cellulose biosynthesis protein BcsQ/WD40 repeat protein
MSERPSRIDGGTIVTFYSYKGGTGRSMALANVAWILASQGQRVLVIDWDLEAPGLHRFFAPFLPDPALAATEGLIDFMVNFANEAATPPEDAARGHGQPAWFEPLANILPYATSLDYPFPARDGEPGKRGTIDFVPAGRQDPGYAHRVAAFDWDIFYERMGGGVFLEAVKRQMRPAYDYILIDSRTGVSDTSGICTVQMPDVLVACFTANNQGIEGAAGVVASVRAQSSREPARRGPARILPVFTRIETSEKSKLEHRQNYAADRFGPIVGEFAPLREDRSKYWEEMQVPYIPFYSYEEILAPFGDQPRKFGDLLSAMERLTSYITDGAIGQLAAPPDEATRQRVLALYEGRSPSNQAGPPASDGREPRRTAALPEAGPTFGGPSTVKKYDAFLSYNASDRAAVVALAQQLSREKLWIYFDELGPVPGREVQGAPFEPMLEQSKAIVMFVGPNAPGPWQTQDIEVAIDRRSRDDTFRVIPVLLPGAERPRRGDVAHLGFLVNAPWVVFRGTIDDRQAFRKLVGAISGVRNLDFTDQYEGVCPYRGLEAFRPEDAPFFFGRESLIGWLVSALRREVTSPEGVRFLAVLGPSGSGKSSVVLAGLLPQLAAGAIGGSDRWPVAILRPGSDPLQSLAAAVVGRSLQKGGPPDHSLATKLARNLSQEESLNLYVRTALRDQPGDPRLVVVVDQFEEVFTNRPPEGEARDLFDRDRASFLANLLYAASVSGGPVAVVLTMASAYLRECSEFPQLAAVIGARQELVGPMGAAELREAIERPAYQVGCDVAPALTERLLADVQGQPGALPTLQFVLTELWKRREGRRLTLRAYDELGGIGGVVEQRAEAVFGQLSPEDRELCRRRFLRLVQPGEGTEDTRRRVSSRELMPDDPERAEAVRRLVRTLAGPGARLVTVDGAEGAEPTVELAHSALLRHWPRLHNLLAAERGSIRFRRRLTDDAQAWDAASPHYKDDYLYSGERLAECRAWAGTHRDELAEVEAAFVDASERAEHRRQLEKLEVQRRWEEADQRAQERREAYWNEFYRRQRFANRLWVASVAAGILAATSVGCAVLAYRLHRDSQVSTEAARKSDLLREAASTQLAEAEARLRSTEALRLAAEARSVARGDWILATLLAVEALNVAAQAEERPLPEAEEAIRTALDTTASLRLGNAAADAIPLLALSRNGRWLVTAERGGSPRLWDLGASRPADSPVILPDVQKTITVLAVAPDGRSVAVGDGEGNVWALDSRQPAAKPSRLGHLTDAIQAMAIGSDSFLIAVDRAKKVASWRLLTPHAAPTALDSMPGNLKAGDAVALASLMVAIAPDRRRVVMATREGRILAADLTGPSPTMEALEVPERAADHLAVTPDGTWLATARGTTARLCHLGAPKPAETWRYLAGARKAITVVALSDDNHWLVTGEGDGTARLWDLTTPDPAAAPVVLRGRDVIPTAAAFRVDGRQLALAGGESRVLLWGLTAPTVDPEPITVPVALRPVLALGFSLDGTWLVTANPSYRLWPLKLENLLGLARRAVGRNLSRDEWGHYFRGQPYRKTFADLPGPTE